MKPPNWDRLQEIYHSALGKPRDAFIAEASAGDPVLLRKIHSVGRSRREKLPKKKENLGDTSPRRSHYFKVG